jgi:hypothetical protein
MSAIRWLASFFEDQGPTSSKKLALITTTVTCNVGLYQLLHAVATRYLAQGGDISLIVGAVMACACSLAGVSYVWGKAIDKRAAAAADAGGEQ